MTQRPPRPLAAPARVIVTRHLMPGVEARMRELFDVVLNESDTPLTRDQLAAAMQDCDVLVPTVTDRIDADLIAGAGERLGLIASFGAGTEHIDLAAAAGRKIIVTNTPGVFTDDTADLAMAAIIGVPRRIRDVLLGAPIALALEVHDERARRPAALAQHAVLLRVERQQPAQVGGAALPAHRRDDGRAIEAALEIEELGAVGLDVGEVLLDERVRQRELSLTAQRIEHVEREHLGERGHAGVRDELERDPSTCVGQHRAASLERHERGARRARVVRRNAQARPRRRGKLCQNGRLCVCARPVDDQDADVGTGEPVLAEQARDALRPAVAHVAWPRPTTT